MAKGLPKSIVKKYGVTKKAWREYRKTGKRKTYKRVKSKSKKRKRKVTKRKRRKSNSFKIPLATATGLGIGLASPKGDSVIEHVQRGNPRGVLIRLGKNYTGFDGNTGKFDLGNMMHGLLPLVVGAMVSKYVGGKPLNLNQRLRNIPFLKI